jgi:hypothetical protein
LASLSGILPVNRIANQLMTARRATICRPQKDQEVRDASSHCTSGRQSVIRSDGSTSNVAG